MGQWKIRIGAAGNRSQVYLDGILINEHNGGFLPIDVSLPIQTPFKQEYRVSIVLDTRLDFQTLPIGEVSNINNRLKQTINYDFSNLIGIHRNVYLYSVPKQSIEDIIIESIFEKNKVYVKYKILTNDAIEKVTIIDPDGYEILTSNLKEDKLLIGNPNLWDIGKGVLYTLKVKTSHDFYEEEFGIREVKIEDNKFRIKEIIPYWQEELIYDFQTKKRIRYHEMMEKILPISDIAQIFILNKNLFVQVENDVKMFGNKNLNDASRLFEIVRDDLINRKRGNFIFVKDITTSQRIQLYNLLEGKGFKRRELFRHYSY